MRGGPGLTSGLIKHLAARYAPGGLVAWAWTQRKRRAPNAWQRRENHLYHRVGDPDVILAGPFRGMKFVRVGYGTSTLQKTLGIYELEIHAAVEAMVAHGPDVFINAGTAEGYYLVGMVMRIPGLHAVGYDRMALQRHLARRVAGLNGVADRVELRSWCSPEDIERVFGNARKPAMVCDIDGGEFACLRPDAAPSLRRAVILVELHDGLVPGVSQEIRRRFATTHEIEAFPVRTHRPDDVPAAYGLTPEEATDCTGLQREPWNFWWLMRPRSVA